MSVHLMILLLTAGLAAAALLGTWAVIARMRGRHQPDDGAELPGAVLSTEDKAVVDEAEAHVYRYWRRRYADPEHREK